MNYTKYKNIMGEIVSAYETMEELYKIKQEALIEGKCEELGNVDGKILDNNELIKTLNNERVEVSNNTPISNIIEMAKNQSNPLEKDFVEVQKKLNSLAKSIGLLETSNMELIKHGLTMADKTLNIIVNAFLPHTSEYNKLGKSVEKQEIRISSVEEEA